MLKILIVVTGVNMYANTNLQTGLWLSELSHIYHKAKERGYEVTLASPHGGNTPMDPESLKPLMLDKVSKAYWSDTSFRNQLRNTNSLMDVADRQFDLVYLTGGHGTMYDFPDNTTLQSMVRKHYEDGKLVAAICHGVSGLLNVRLSNGQYLVKGKTITGFNWFEESLARRRRKVPFNLEQALKDRDANYSKAFIPMTSKVLVDGNLITGQNPFSSKEMAEVVMEQLKKLE